MFSKSKHVKVNLGSSKIINIKSKDNLEKSVLWGLRVKPELQSKVKIIAKVIHSSFATKLEAGSYECRLSFTAKVNKKMTPDSI